MQNELTSTDIRLISEEIERESQSIYRLSEEINKVIVGQEKMVESLMVGLLANGHILLEGVPGLAKTLAIKTLSDAVNGSFSRIQFTPDLLPADVVGTLIYNIRENQFDIKKGRSSPISCWQTRSTVHPQKYSRHCSKQCRKDR